MGRDGLKSDSQLAGEQSIFVVNPCSISAGFREEEDPTHVST